MFETSQACLAAALARAESSHLHARFIIIMLLITTSTRPLGTYIRRRGQHWEASKIGLHNADVSLPSWHSIDRRESSGWHNSSAPNPLRHDSRCLVEIVHHQHPTSTTAGSACATGPVSQTSLQLHLECFMCHLQRRAVHRAVWENLESQTLNDALTGFQKPAAPDERLRYETRDSPEKSAHRNDKLPMALPSTVWRVERLRQPAATRYCLLGLAHATKASHSRSVSMCRMRSTVHLLACL